MVYLANTLREVVEAAPRLMTAPASPSGRGTEKGVRPAVVVEHADNMYGSKTILRARLAALTDGAIAP